MQLHLDSNDQLIPPASLHEGIERANKLAGEIARIEDQLDPDRQTAFTEDGFKNWQPSVKRVLERHQLEHRQLLTWIDVERDKLIQRTATLFETLVKEGTDFTASEIETIKELNHYLSAKRKDHS